MERKNEENGVFRHFLPSFCLGNGKKSLVLLLFLLFFFVCARNFVILARISRMRVHNYIFAQILTPNQHLDKRNKRAKSNSCWSMRISAGFIHKELGAVLNPV